MTDPAGASRGPRRPLSLSLNRDPISQIVDHVILLATEAQTAFADRYTGRAWQADFDADPAVFWFEGDTPATFRPQFVGSSSTVSNTWLWGWENINEFPAAVIALAERIRDVGHGFGVPELTTAYQTLAASDASSVDHPVPHNLELLFVYCAMAMDDSAAPVYYRAPFGDGYAWFVLDNPEEFALPAPTTLAVVSAITRAVQTGHDLDARLALAAYADRRSGIVVDSAAPDQLTVHTSNGHVEIRLDDSGRITNMSTS